MFKQLTEVEPLKDGGQKEVFSAKHPEYGDVVFKKIFQKDNSFERTRREVRAVSIIDSPNIPKIIAHNCDEDDPEYLWLLEPKITGLNLREILESKRVFSFTEIVAFLETMLPIAVLSEENNLVHRDIKPENIILDDDGKFWLLDFGIARHLDLDSITQTDSPYGVFTIGYASSEQFRNMKSEIDIRADLFSIGVVCFEMIKGENFYISGTENNILRVLKKLESSSLPPFRLDGDSQYLLSTFINLLGDHRRTRRPRTAKEAILIFNSLKSTLKI